LFLFQFRDTKFGVLQSHSNAILQQKKSQYNYSLILESVVYYVLFICNGDFFLSPAKGQKIILQQKKLQLD